ncbi:hypothetical protein ACFYVR_15875 [Rhodococcus sp. NPDC003318]|uniref:hypothetical protein n=1 Tax=Rhodococcus sp. NPDC003318 TaxID=3364503 RepID=UPI0036BCF083
MTDLDTTALRTAVRHPRVTPWAAGTVLALCDEIDQLRAENGAARGEATAMGAYAREMKQGVTVRDAALDRVRALHRPVEVEPSDTICGECSYRLSNGRYFGKVEDYPCPTIRALDGAP